MVSAMISLALLPENFFCLRSPGYSIIRRYNNTISGGRRTQVRANKPEMLDTTADWISTFLLGWAVTIVSGISAYPLDTVKRQESILCRQIKQAPLVLWLRKRFPFSSPLALLLSSPL